jgi:predicted DNA binding protein
MSGSDGGFGVDESRWVARRRWTDGGLRVEPYEISAELRLSHPEFVLHRTLESVDDVSVRPQFASTGRGETLFLSAFGEEFDAFEEALVTDPSVTDPARVSADEEHRLYRVRVAEDARWVAAPVDPVEWYVAGIEGADGAWFVRIYVPNRQVLAKIRNAYRAAGAAFRIRQLHSVDGRRSRSRYGLRTEQETLLRTAYEAGYYAVPRDVSQRELADEFGVSPSAISQQLRRSTATLIASTLATNRKR